MASRLESWLGKNAFALSPDPVYTSLFHASELCALQGNVYLTNEECGIGLVFDEVLCLKAIHLTPPQPGHEDVLPALLPFNLRFDFARERTRAQLAHLVSKEGGGVVHRSLGLVPAWEQYFPEGYYLHLEYSGDEASITRITLGVQAP